MRVNLWQHSPHVCASFNTKESTAEPGSSVSDHHRTLDPLDRLYLCNLVGPRSPRIQLLDAPKFTAEYTTYARERYQLGSCVSARVGHLPPSHPSLCATPKSAWFPTPNFFHTQGSCSATQGRVTRICVQLAALRGTFIHHWKVGFDSKVTQLHICT